MSKKKIVVIASSPRRNGNSEVLANQFIKGANEAGHEVEKIVLNDFSIAPCIACEYCRNHDHLCILNDDANKVIEKIITADVFVMATPVYFYSLSAQLKILIDRLFAREYEIRSSCKFKEAYLIITSGSPEIKEMTGTVESFKGFIKVLKKVKLEGVVYGLGAFQRGDAQKHVAYQQAYQMGLKV